MDGGDDVVDGEHLLVERQGEAELLVDLVAAHLGQVVTLGVEVVVLQQLLGSVARRRLAGTQLLVDVEQRLILGVDTVVLLQGLTDRLVLTELLKDALRGPAQRLEEDGDVLLALAVQTHAHRVTLVDLELEPGATRGNHLAAVDVLVGRLVGVALEVDARGTHQLGDDDALGAADDEGALGGHEWEITDEDGLRLDLAGLVVGELGRDEQRRGVRAVAILALVEGVLGIFEAVVTE